jgi:hypothetical protein
MSIDLAMMELDADLQEFLQAEHQDSLVLQAAFDCEAEARDLLRTYVPVQMEAAVLDDMVLQNGS